MAEDQFDIWLGRMDRDPGLRAALRRVVNLAGGRRTSGNGRRGFTGARSGRGSAAGALLLASTARYAGRRA